MRIVIHVKKFFDWLPVPADVKVTEQDIKKRLVKPNLGGGFLMRVEKDQATYTEIGVSEADLIAEMIVAKLKRKVSLNRAQVVAEILSSRVMPDEAKPKWMTKIEVQDDFVPDHLPTPEEKEAYVAKARDFLRSHLMRFLSEGLLDEEDADELTEAYLTHFTDRELEKKFAAHFGIKAEA